PCALVRPSRGLLGMKWELVWMSGGSELDLGGKLLEWWSPGEEGVVQLRSTAGSCKKVESGRLGKQEEDDDNRPPVDIVTPPKHGIRYDGTAPLPLPSSPFHWNGCRVLGDGGHERKTWSFGLVAGVMVGHPCPLRMEDGSSKNALPEDVAFEVDDYLTFADDVPEEASFLSHPSVHRYPLVQADDCAANKTKITDCSRQVFRPSLYTSWLEPRFMNA
ncbi:hypothetical protein BHM03_00049881, partial [Ensete ventricosum]